MKKVLFLVVLLSTMVFANERVLVNVLKNVSIPNVQTAIDNAKILQKDTNAQNFTNFLKSWKKVEALYFAGDIDENYADTPRYIDIFNNLKEDDLSILAGLFYCSKKINKEVKTLSNWLMLEFFTISKALFAKTENQIMVAIVGTKMVAKINSLIVLPFEIRAINIPVNGTQANQKAQ